MSDGIGPRFSIIPAGAVTDPRLEGRDLQVLCLLGIHTDDEGWCFRSQVEMAKQLRCGRSSIQRSLERLYDADWVERHHRTNGKIIPDLTHPHAAHAYRVKLDRNVPVELLKCGSESEVVDQEGAHGRAPLGTGCPRMHGHMNDDSNDSESESIRAREPLISEEAVRIAEEIGKLAGVGVMAEWPPGWCGSPMRVDQFLREGFHPDLLLLTARAVMAGRKETDPPWSIEYFAKAFAKAKGRQNAGLPPIPEVKTGQRSRAAEPRPGSSADRLERTTNVRRKWREYAYGPQPDGGDRSGEVGGQLPGRLCLPKPTRP